MLTERTRIAVLELSNKGLGVRAIARALAISRKSVSRILKSGKAAPSRLDREELCEPYREQIAELYARSKGNLVRVHEELAAAGCKASYQALTSFCRRHLIGRQPQIPSGRYDFAPGQEMQHDTSPHKAKIAGRMRDMQTASLVLAHSRMIFIQCYPRFTRFECKVFLTDAISYFGGAADKCMIDNTHVVVLKGSGRDMVAVPEMLAFGERFGFSFIAHEIGDANRSARVEGPFNYVDRNFLAGREFADWDAINIEAQQWCDRVNAKYSSKLHASRLQLFAGERLALKKLPAFVPEVYALHHRIVDAEGYVSVGSNRYSVPYKLNLIGRQVEVQESKQRVDIYDGPRQVATHRRCVDAQDARINLPEHRPPRGEGRKKCGPPPEQAEVLTAEPALTAYVTALKAAAAGRGTRALQKLLRMLREYPRQPLLDAVRSAEQFGLYDLDRLERMILRQIANDYFPPPDIDGEMFEQHDHHRGDGDER
jgi:transposase